MIIFRLKYEPIAFRHHACKKFEKLEPARVVVAGKYNVPIPRYTPVMKR